MKITEDTIPVIEKALGITLYEEQKQYLLSENNAWSASRPNGKIFAYSIKLALSEGTPLNIEQPNDFSDSEYAHKKHKTRYSPFFMNYFRDMRNKLMTAGLPVRELEA